jgi:hypothetical protein
MARNSYLNKVNKEKILGLISDLVYKIQYSYWCIKLFTLLAYRNSSLSYSKYKRKINQ